MKILDGRRGVYIGSGTYVGPLAHLKGKTAILRTDRGKLLAQFDDVELTRGGNWRAHGIESLGYGWHEFNQSDFEEVKQES